MRDSVAGVLKDKNRYLLGKRKLGGDIGGLWEFPGGKVRYGETHSDALKREFLEELNIEVIVGSFIVKKEFLHNEKEYCLNAYYIESKSRIFNHREHSEFRWFTLKEIYSLGKSFVESDRLLLESL